VFCIICPMTRIQISTSKKPASGAMYLKPLHTKINRTVSGLTSRTLAPKIRMGKMIQAWIGELENRFAVMSATKASSNDRRTHAATAPAVDFPACSPSIGPTVP